MVRVPIEDRDDYTLEEALEDHAKVLQQVADDTNRLDGVTSKYKFTKLDAEDYLDSISTDLPEIENNRQVANIMKR